MAKTQMAPTEHPVFLNYRLLDGFSYFIIFVVVLIKNAVGMLHVDMRMINC